MSSILKVDEIQNTDGKTGLVITPDGSIDGIKFPEEANPSGRTITSTTMSSYEEGTWSPVMRDNGFTQSVDTITGDYIKVGNIVYVSCVVYFAASAYASSWGRIASLPFNLSSDSGFGVGGYTSGSLAGESKGGIAFAGSTMLYYHSAVNDNTSTSWNFSAVYQTV